MPDETRVYQLICHCVNMANACACHPAKDFSSAQLPKQTKALCSWGRDRFGIKALTLTCIGSRIEWQWRFNSELLGLAYWIAHSCSCWNNVGSSNLCIHYLCLNPCHISKASATWIHIALNHQRHNRIYPCCPLLDGDGALIGPGTVSASAAQPTEAAMGKKHHRYSAHLLQSVTWSVA